MGCGIQPYGLIGEHWRAHGGENSPFACPTTEEYGFPDRPDRRQDFVGGQIGFSPNQGPRMIVAAYGEHVNGVLHATFTWGLTHPFNYDVFIVRWSQSGMVPTPPDRQVEISTGIASRTFGVHRIPVPMDQIGSDGRHATFNFIVEGCDRTAFSGLECKQSWTIPVSVRA